MKIDATTFQDVSDNFEFLEDNLEYYDAPISGYLRHRPSGLLFAFECVVVVVDCVWHWSLVPVDKVGDEASDVVRNTLAGGSTEWLSVLEDRRHGASRCTSVPMPAGAKPAVLRG